MSRQAKRDFQILKLFMVLATLTIVFVLGLKVVLFAPPSKAGDSLRASAVQLVPSEVTPGANQPFRMELGIPSAIDRSSDSQR